MKKVFIASLFIAILLSLVLLSTPVVAAFQVKTHNVAQTGQLNTPTWDPSKYWDFEDHGNTHSHFNRLTAAQIQAEEDAVYAAFSANLGAIPQHFAYPYGDYNATVEYVLSANGRVSGRMVWGEMMSYPVSNWMEMKAINLKKATTWRTAKGWVDSCIATKSLLHIYTHDVSASPSAYGATTQMLTQLLDYVKQQKDLSKLQVMTMTEAYDAWKKANPGKATLVISFDDGNQSDYQVVYPLFKDRSLKGTSYIVASWVGQKGRLTWSDIINMRNGQQ